MCIFCDSHSAEKDDSIITIYIALPILVVTLLGLLTSVTCIICVFLKRRSPSSVKRQLSAHNTMYKMALNSPGIKPDPLEFPRSQLVMEETLGMLCCVNVHNGVIIEWCQRAWYYTIYGTKFLRVLNFANFLWNHFNEQVNYTCKSVDGQHPKAMLLNPQGMLAKEIVDSSENDSVTVRIRYATPMLHYACSVCMI